MVETKRKKGETFEAFLRRFNKRLMQSGQLLQFKKIRYTTKEQSKYMTRKSAVHKKKVKEKREYLKKIGRITEDDNRRRRRH